MESIVARAAFSVVDKFIRQSVAERLAQPFSMSFQVGRGCLPLIITRQRLSDTRRRLSVQLGPRRGHESAWCLLGFAGGNHADRAGFRHVFSYPRCLFSRNALLFHFSFRLWPAASEGKEQHRTACNGQPTSLLNSPASQEPSHPAIASQSRAGSRLLQPHSVRA